MKVKAIDNTKKMDYVLIKDFNKFMTNGTKQHGKNYTC